MLAFISILLLCLQMVLRFYRDERSFFLYMRNAKCVNSGDIGEVLTSDEKGNYTWRKIQK